MRRALALAGLMLFLAACLTAQKDRFYTLNASESSTAPASGAASGYTVAVGPVTVPEIVDRPQIVVGVAPNEVTLYEQHRWAAPLQSDIARVIVANLAQQLGTARVWSAPAAARPTADYQVLVDVRRFDSIPGEAVVVDALWLIRPATGSDAKLGRSLVREPTSGSGIDALVAAHSRALTRVSQDIATALRGL